MRLLKLLKIIFIENLNSKKIVSTVFILALLIIATVCNNQKRRHGESISDLSQTPAASDSSFTPAASDYSIMPAAQPSLGSSLPPDIGHNAPRPAITASALLSPDNPIDRAFARVNSEHQGELADNVVFAYLNAVEWYYEYYNLTEQQGGEDRLNKYSLLSWITEEYQDFSPAKAALDYAAYWSGSNRADASYYQGIAQFYKLMIIGCTGRPDGMESDLLIQTDEEELYQYLHMLSFEEFYYEESTFKDTSEGFDILSSIDERWTEYPLPMLASLPEEGIYLSFAPPFGAVLTVGDDKYFYLWPDFLTPRLVLPMLFKGDYDHDGTDELAVNFYIGSGTEFAVEDLHILEYADLSTDRLITSDTIEALLKNRISADYHPETETVTVRLDEQVVTADIYSDENLPPAELQMVFSDIIYFDAREDILTVHIAIGLRLNAPFPTTFVDFYADINYDETAGISLSDCRIS